MRNLFFCFTKWNDKRIKLLFLLLGSISCLNAQVINITGVVTDGKDVTLPGVSINVKGTSKTNYTNFDGSYSIKANKGDVLVYNFIGFRTQEISVAESTQINVKMYSEVQKIEEVVINVGYRTQKKKDVLGAISTINSKDIEDSQQVTIEQLLQGRATGVTITNNSGQPGGDASVRIRGISSLGGSNEPLYIIDGIPIDGSATDTRTGGNLVKGYSGGNSGNVTTSPLSFINPNDIEDISVLKDASATAIYGARANNGVIIITTKRGKKGKGKIEYETAFSIQNVTRLLKTMTLSQYATQQNALAEIYKVPLRDEFAVPSVLGDGTNWQDEIYRTAIMKSHNLSFSGGKDGISYLISGGYLDQEGTVIGSGFKRYTLRGNLDTSVTNWLNIGMSLSGGITNDILTINGYSDGIISNSILTSPDTAVRNTDGSYAGPPENTTIGGSWINPVAAALINSNELSKRNYAINLFATSKITKGLEYRIDFGANSSSSTFTGFQPTYTWGSAIRESNQLDERTNEWYGIYIKNVLNYKNKFGKHNVGLLLGQESNSGNWSGKSISVSGLLGNDIRVIQLGTKASLTASEYKGASATNSYFSAFNYDYADRYGLQATMRADGSSNFAPGRRWGYYPSASVFWKLSNEIFMAGIKKYIDNIKFRLGYGETGNQNVAGGLFNSNISRFNTALGNAFLAANISNVDLTWEKAKSTNIGLDFSLFNSKLNVTVDAFKRKSEGFLYQLPVPDYVVGTNPWEGGIGKPTVNLGSMSNKGIEAVLNFSNKFGNNFTWSANFNISKYVNNLESLGEKNNFAITRDAQVNGFTTKTVTKTEVGQPVGQFYGYQSVGIIRTNEQLASAPLVFTGTKAVQSQLGDIEYVDQNKDGLIDEKDLTYIGSPHPNFTYGFSNNLKYKNVDFNIALSGSQGNKAMNLTRRAATTNQRLYQNQLAEAADFWTPTNVNAKYPRPDGGDGNANIAISDRYVEDASYLRISNITLAYSINPNYLSKLNISKLRFYLGIQNLYTFTKYTGYDPEIGSYNQDALLSGVDAGRYPTNRTYTFGLNLGF